MQQAKLIIHNNSSGYDPQQNYRIGTVDINWKLSN